MTKKNSNLLLPLFMAVAAFSCTKNNHDNAVYEGLYSDIKKQQKIPTVIHITEYGGVDDNSFNASIWRGVNKFYNEYGGMEGVDYTYMVTPSLDQMENNLNIATDESPTLIIAAGFNFQHALDNIASRNPEQRYLHIDGTEFTKKNIKSVQFADEQSAFLVGALAALKSKEDRVANPVFGFIGGMPGAVITRFEMGYLQGIKYVLGNDAKIVSYYADDWANPGKAKTITKQWINQYPSLYAIFSAAGPTGNGTIAQVKESFYDGRLVWAIGVDSDQYIEGLVDDGQSVVLTSAMKNADVAVYQTLVELEKGQFRTGQQLYNIENDGVGFSQSNTSALSEALLAQIQRIKDEVRNRDILVFQTVAQVEKAGLLHNYSTDAKDD